MVEPLKYFIPDERHALILCNSDYAKLRMKEHFGGFSDLEEVKDDKVNVIEGLKRFGFGDLDIRVEENFDNKKITSLMREYRIRFETNNAR